MHGFCNSIRIKRQLETRNNAINERPCMYVLGFTDIKTEKLLPVCAESIVKLNCTNLILFNLI